MTKHDLNFDHSLSEDILGDQCVHCNLTNTVEKVGKWAKKQTKTKLQNLNLKIKYKYL